MIFQFDNRGLFAPFFFDYLERHETEHTMEISNNQQEDCIVLNGTEIQCVWELKITDLYDSTIGSAKNRLHDELYRLISKYPDIPILCGFYEPDLERCYMTTTEFRETIHSMMNQFSGVIYFYEWKKTIDSHFKKIKFPYDSFIKRFIKYCENPNFHQTKLYPKIIGKNDKNMIQTLLTLPVRMGSQYATHLVETAKELLGIDNLTLEVLCDISIDSWDEIMKHYKGKKPCSAKTLYNAIHGGK